MKKFSKKTQSMIDTYYRTNQQVLNKAGYSKDIFEANIKALMDTNNVRAKRAIKIFEHKTDFTDKNVIGAENMISNIKKTPTLYHDLRKEVVG